VSSTLLITDKAGHSGQQHRERLHTRRGWQFEFTSGQGGPLLATYTTAGADGSVTVPLNALSSLWPATAQASGFLESHRRGAPFGAIRCYNDMLNGDNLEQITSVPNNLVQVYCFAYKWLSRT